jgi:hypothetical protein
MLRTIVEIGEIVVTCAEAARNSCGGVREAIAVARLFDGSNKSLDGFISIATTIRGNPKKRDNTMDAESLLESRRSSKSGALLKGSDVPATVKSIKIEVAEFRESPKSFGAPGIIDLKKPVYSKTAWAVNKTNVKLLIKLFGPDTKKWIGKKIKLDLVPTANPTTGEMVRTLVVSAKQ